VHHLWEDDLRTRTLDLRRDRATLEIIAGCRRVITGLIVTDREWTLGRQRRGS
jgi:hypothetical protein